MTNFDERARDWDSDPDKVERARTVAEVVDELEDYVPTENDVNKPWQL